MNFLIPDKKPTDNEIKKALECCITYKQLCPMICPMHNDSHCLPKLKEYALDLINRKDAEIESLQAENERLNEKVDFVGDLKNIRKQIKAEAYKECIEKVKEKAYTYSDITGYRSTVVDVCEIDGVYEELVGDNNAD